MDTDNLGSGLGQKIGKFLGDIAGSVAEIFVPGSKEPLSDAIENVGVAVDGYVAENDRSKQTSRKIAFVNMIKGDPTLSAADKSKAQNLFRQAAYPGLDMTKKMTLLAQLADIIGDKPYVKLYRPTYLTAQLAGSGKSATKRSKYASKVQSVVFTRPQWTVPRAARWLRKHHFIVKKVDVTATQLRFRQRSPKPFKRYISKKVKDGILIIIGFYH